jgi:hypothetical protein
MNINRNEAKEIILGTNGKLFSVTFIKKDGSLRDMTCRLGVQKHLKGGKSTTSHIERLITVFEMISGISEPRYRNINTETLTRVRVDGETFEVN